MRKFAICEGYEDKATMPKRGTKGSAGYDLTSINEIPVDIQPGETVKFITGIKAYMESDEVLMIHVRSSVGIKRGLVLANTTGVIDSDYVNSTNGGNIIIALYNNSGYTQTIQPKERIAQAIFMKYLITDNDDASGVRTGGIGSTGNV